MNPALAALLGSVTTAAVGVIGVAVLWRALKRDETRVLASESDELANWAEPNGRRTWSGAS